MQGASLHEHAVQAESHLEAIATGLAHAGADEETVQSVTQMADTVRELVKAFGAGQEQTGDAEPPAPQPQRPTLDTATAELHQMMQPAGGTYA